MNSLLKLLPALCFFQTLELSAAEVSNGWKQTWSDGGSPSRDGGPPSLHAGTWKRLPDLPDPIGVAGAFAGVSGGALIVAGGANFPDAPPWEGGKKVWHDTIWALEKPDGEWKQAGKLPKPNGYGVSATHQLGFILVGGGDADQNNTDVWSLSYKDGEVNWSPLPSMPSPLANSCGILAGGGLYVAGGIESPTSTTASASFRMLAFLADLVRWETLPTWPGPARQLAIAGAHDRTFYLVGGTSLEAGRDGKPVRTYLRDAYAFRHGTGWKRIADLPFPLAASPSPAATVNGKLVIFGGDDAPSADPKTHKGFRDEMLEYDPASDKWTIIGHMPAPRATAPVVFWNGGYVIVSGEIRRGVRSREVWMWTP